MNKSKGILISLFNKQAISMKWSLLLSFFLGFVFFNIDIIKAQDSTPQPGVLPVNPEFTFRQTKWGMSKNEVKNSEKLKLISGSANSLFYRGIVNGMVTLVVYKFSKDKLSSGTYIFEEEHSNKNDYIDYYDKAKSPLIRIYGKPKDDRTDWKNDVFRQSPQNWGTAISAGYLEYLTFWETDKTKILLSLSGENYEMKFFLSYRSIEYGLNEKDEE